MIALLRLPLLAFFVFPVLAKAQNKPDMEFGKVSAKDFLNENFIADTSNGAIIIADIGKSSFIGNDKGWFSLVFKHQRRVKIMSNKAFDIATVKIPLYRSDRNNDEEKLESLKASTYNLVDGKVQETRLDKQSIFKEIQDKNHSLQKFTMPAVKEGSIIEYSYTVTSDFLFNLQPWSFQGYYPRLWSEYELNLPSFFEYVFLAKGYQPFHLKEQKEKFQTYSLSQKQQGDFYPISTVKDFTISSNNMISRWVMTKVPAIKEENFTSAIDNHISSIEFQMSGQQFPDMPRKDVMGSWATAATELMKDEEFGADFAEENFWLLDDIKSFKLDNKTPLEKTRTIYEYLQNNFSCKGIRGIKLSQKLKETLKTKKGYVADINMLMTLMLSTAGINARPVILSTRKNGLPTAEYPLLGQYNYLISKVFVDDKTYYLDASDPMLGFNKLPEFCYNGTGICIVDSPTKEPLYPNSITESKNIFISMVNDVKANKWTGNFSSSSGYYESVNIRRAIWSEGKEKFIEHLKSSYGGYYSLDSVEILSLDKKEEAIKINYVLNINREDNSNFIYFNPMIKEGLKENYFKSAERNYPVELPEKTDQSYILNVEVPEGYIVDEMPKSARVMLSDDDGGFEYIISKTSTDIELRVKLKLNKTIFMPDEYEGLKNFFDFVVKKHAEPIVFKRKSL